MKFLFDIQPNSGVPIYRQIIEQVERFVVSGILKPGDELPSVRQTAKEFDINPMTISKAYSFLEEKNVITRLRGKGMIVSENKKKPKAVDDRLKLMQPILEEVSRQAKQLNISANEVSKKLKKIMEEKK